jgi:hypothetical protein
MPWSSIADWGREIKAHIEEWAPDIAREFGDERCGSNTVPIRSPQHSRYLSHPINSVIDSRRGREVCNQLASIVTSVARPPSCFAAVTLQHEFEANLKGTGFDTQKAMERDFHALSPC